MLQTNKARSAFDHPAVASEFASTAEVLNSYIGFVRRQYSVILFAVVLTIALGAVYVMSAPPGFTAQATMIIDSRKVQAFQQQAIIGDIPVDSATVESQVEVLKSENIALAVIKDLHLAENPEFAGSGDGLVSLGAFLGVFFGPAFDTAISSAPSSDYELLRRALKTFQDRLGVKRVGLTYVIQISFRSVDPERAAQIANAVADAYIVDQLEAKYQATRRAGAWLQDRIRELREQASTAERAVVEFKTKNNIVDAGGRLINEQQLAELNSQLVVARAQTSESRARLDRISAVLRADTPDASVDATVTDTFNNQVVTKLRSQYLELANREADWSSRYGKNHLAAVNLRNQMREIRNSILDELRRLAESYKSDYEIAKQREEGVQKNLADAVSQSQTTNQAQVALRELESSAQTYRALYDNFLQRYMESVQQQSFPISEARVISAASRPLIKSHPRTMLILAAATAGGLMLGFGIGMWREFSDRVFRTPEQVEALLQADCLAVVPIIKTGEPAKPPPDDKKGDGPPAPRTLVPDQGIVWTVVNSPFGRFTEAIRTIKLAVDLSEAVKSTKVIACTSALPNEGKSTIAASLAQAMSQAGARVILIDCDLRNPTLTRTLAPTAKAGIIEVVFEKVPLKDVVWTDRSGKLSFLPGAVKSRLAYSGEILASKKMEMFFDELRQQYNYVVVDLSPLAPIVDVRATTQFVDSYLFTVEWGRTGTDVVERGLKSARGIADRLLGVVLNKTNIDLLGRYDGQGTHYNKHYGRYGYTE